MGRGVKESEPTALRVGDLDDPSQGMLEEIRQVKGTIYSFSNGIEGRQLPVTAGHLFIETRVADRNRSLK